MNLINPAVSNAHCCSASTATPFLPPPRAKCRQPVAGGVLARYRRVRRYLCAGRMADREFTELSVGTLPEHS